MSFTYTDFVNGLWDPTANALGRVDVLSDTLKLVLVDTAIYFADQDADVSLADIAAGARISTATPSGITVIDRALTFDPVIFTAVTGADVNAAALYKDTGTAATSPLIAYLDTFASGIPFTPDGTDRELVPDAAGLVIF